jgi:hypothetical protein
MSKCGYACINCGLCRGEIKDPILVTKCLQCGFENERGSKICAKCGASLSLQAGITNTAGVRGGFKK